MTAAGGIPPEGAEVAAALLAWLRGPFALDARLARGERPVIGVAGESGAASPPRRWRWARRWRGASR